MNSPCSDVPRDSRIDLRVSSEEKQKIVALASAAGLTVSAYLIGLALGDKFGQVIVDSVHAKTGSGKRKK